MANLCTKLAMAMSEIETLEVIFKICETALVEVLSRKYEVKAVSIVWSVEYINFRKEELIKPLIEAKSIFKLWYWEKVIVHFLFSYL